MKKKILLIPSHVQDTGTIQALIGICIFERDTKTLLRDTFSLILPPSETKVESASSNPKLLQTLTVSLIQLYSEVISSVNKFHSKETSKNLEESPDFTHMDKKTVLEACKFLLDIPGGLAFETLRMVSQ